MEIIADSSATRTEWAIVDEDRVVERAFTSGVNPYFMTRREISHVIRLELPDSFFRHRWRHIWFYGAGCATVEKCKVMEASLVTQFKSPATVNSDILGAARGLFVRRPGLACILGTGSNSCLYDGESIVRTVRPLGYILGDEGSNAYMGRLLIADVLKGLAPDDISDRFFARFGVSPVRLMDDVYSASMPGRVLASYASFLTENIADQYVSGLVRSALTAFFERNILAYDYKDKIVGFVGSAAVTYEPLLREVAAGFGIEIAAVRPSSMHGLVEYHSI